MIYSTQRTLPAASRQDNRHRGEVPGWVVMTDEKRLPDPSGLIPCLPPGSAVIVRHRDAATAAVLAKHLMATAGANDITVLLSAPNPPRTLFADGVHIPEAALANWRACDFQRLAPALVTVSAHDLRAVVTAGLRGADAVVLSPVFATQSHVGARPLGLMRFARISQRSGLPVIALGGIAGTGIRRVRYAGAAGIAGIGLFHTHGATE